MLSKKVCVLLAVVFLSGFISIGCDDEGGDDDVNPRFFSPTASFSPSYGDTGVAVDSNIVITFSEAMNTGGSWSVMVNSASYSNSSSGVSWTSGTVLTIDPSANFTRGSTVTVTLNGFTAASDGYALTGNTSFEFTVMDSSTATFSPEHGVTGVEIDSNIVITFSEAMNTGNSWYVMVNSTLYTSVSSGVSWSSDTVLTIDPVTNFTPGLTVTVALSNFTTAYDGTDLGGDTSFIFSVDSIAEKLSSSDGYNSDFFGYSVAMSADGGTIVSGSYYDDDNGNNSGSAYIYKYNGNSWVETKITASDGNNSDYFGFSVAVSADGSTIVAGAYGDDDNGSASGSAYIYQYNGSTWDETKITASDGAADDSFGWSVAVSGDGETVFAGAYHDNTSRGSVYVYRYNDPTWDYEGKITATDSATNDYFGWRISVSADGNTLAVGAHYDDDNGSDSGSGYIYKYNGTSWVETKITASDGAAYYCFGYSVAVSADGNTVVYGSQSGSAYIYKYNGTSWVETKITASDGVTYDRFGHSVAVSPDCNTVVVGAYYDNDNGSASGSAYIYKYNGTSWDETKITASDGAADDMFGISVSVSSDGSMVVVGAPYDNDNGDNSGSAYIFYWNGSQWLDE